MDSKRNIGSPDKDRINVNEAYELQYWSKKLNVSGDELKKAVAKAGTSAKAVQRYLRGE